MEQTRSASVLDSVSTIGFAALFVLGVINCVLGYRLLRFWMMLFGFLIGGGIGLGVAYTMGIQEKYMYAVIMIGVGILLAVLAFLSYKVGIFIIGAGIGLGLGIYVFHPTTSLVFFFCLLLGVGLGVLAMKWARVVLIVGTSLLGGTMAGFSLAKFGGLADIPYGLSLSVGCALLGMLIQFATNRRVVIEEEEYDPREYEKARRSSDYVDTEDYLPRRKRETEEEQKSREAKLNRSLLFLSILSVFSALIDSFDFSASFLGGTLKFGPAVVHGVQGVCILLIFLTAAGVLKSLFVSKKEKLKE